MHRPENPGPCAIHGLLEVLARPWTMHILWTLSTNGPTRFGVLRRQVGGISSRVLTERLRTFYGLPGLQASRYARILVPSVRTDPLIARLKSLVNT